MEEEIYINVELATKPVNPRLSTNHTGPIRSRRRFHGAVVLCLGLLSVCLLAGLVGLAVHYAELSALKAAVTEERDLLNARLLNMTRELNILKPCPGGWMKFIPSCYRLSESDSWDNARKDCRSMGADLVVIDSAEEQEFLYSFTKKNSMAWIGLTDIVEEGTWKWINGAPPSLQYWREAQPDNGGTPEYGEEDCAHIYYWEGSNTWNDLSCNKRLRGICEKMV